MSNTPPQSTESDWISTVDLSAFCGRGPCWLIGGHDGPCEPGSRLDPRRAPTYSPGLGTTNDGSNP